MRRAARTAAVSAPALVVVAAAWLRLEQPLTSLWRVLALLAVALVVALPRRRSLRLVAAVAATVAAAWVAVGVDLVPWRLDSPGSAFGLAHSLSALGTRFGNGFGDFYGTHLPFDPRVHVGDERSSCSSAIFLFALGVTLLVAERKPVAGALVLLAGAGWPATLLGASHEIVMGAAILAAALVLLAGLGSRRWPALALPAVAVVAVAAVAVGSATAARHGLVHWQTWNLAHVATGPERRRLRLERAVRRAQVVGEAHDRASGAIEPSAVLSARDGARRLRRRRVEGRAGSACRLARARGDATAARTTPARS